MQRSENVFNFKMYHKGNIGINIDSMERVASLNLLLTFILLTCMVLWLRVLLI